MQVARCTEDHIIYTAAEFSRMHPNESDRKRRLLLCPECDGPAFFRNVSRNGRVPCFGARPHSNTCRLAAQDYERPACRDDEEQFAQTNSGNRIILDFNFGARVRSDCAEVFEHTPNLNGSDRYGGHSERDIVRIQRCRLSSILRKLSASPLFGQSDQVIEIPQYCERTAQAFFVSLLATTNDYAGLFRGYWGFLSDAKFALDRSLWFNSGGSDNISFCLGAQHVDEFRQRYCVEDLEDLAGADILVIGTPQIARNGKLFCLIDNLAYMALRRGSVTVQGRKMRDSTGKPHFIF